MAKLKAFSLPELLVVLVIIGILVLIALPNLMPLIQPVELLPVSELGEVHFIAIGGAGMSGIAAGFLDGAGLSTLKGALMSRGTLEISRLIAELGGDPRSAYGLCHLGDYEATVFSKHSHNRQFGESFVRGEEFTALAEGYYTADAVVRLSKQYRVDLPICSSVYRILYEKVDPRKELDALFSRSIKNEF